MNITKIYHLSHTDLDGYGCQFITKTFVESKKDEYLIDFYNSNYGKEIEQRFDDILGDVKRDICDSRIILITDLNLNSSQCEKIDNLVAFLNKNDKETKLLLLDHHEVSEYVKKYSWYNVDITKSATKITYDRFFKGNKKDALLNQIVKVIDVFDLWKCEEREFETSKVLMKLVSTSKEVNKDMFPKHRLRYIIHLIRAFYQELSLNKSYIEIDDNMNKIRKSFFSNKNSDTLDNLSSSYIVDILTKNRDKYIIRFDKYTAVLTMNILNISLIGNKFLKQNPDIDFFMNVSSKKTVSFRSIGDIDVSKIAKALANGGGHKNASGGSLSKIKDVYSYNSIKHQIEEIINQQTST